MKLEPPGLPARPSTDRPDSPMVFDDFVRADIDFAQYSEGDFAFLNRSARPEFAAVRALIEDWFSRYPATHQAALGSRLRSRTPHQFDSAFFELYLHEL